MSEINFEDIASAEIAGYSVSTKLVTLETAKRHAVRLNNIKASKNTYQVSNTITSRELISDPVQSIAIFCNEYIPSHFPDGEYIKYVLTVNGIDYTVVPVNSDRNGTKIIRAADNKTPTDYVAYTNEEIKSATLTVILKTPNNTETPYFSNLKVLIGGE